MSNHTTQTPTFSGALDSVTALAGPDLFSRTALTETGSGGCTGSIQSAEKGRIDPKGESERRFSACLTRSARLTLDRDITTGSVKLACVRSRSERETVLKCDQNIGSTELAWVSRVLLPIHSASGRLLPSLWNRFRILTALSAWQRHPGTAMELSLPLSFNSLTNTAAPRHAAHAWRGAPKTCSAWPRCSRPTLRSVVGCNAS